MTASTRTATRAPRFIGRNPPRPALLLAALMMAGASIVAVLVWVAAAGQDRVALEKEAHVARSGLAAALEDLGQTTTDYAWWDTAREKLIDRPDPDWAAFNIGAYLAKTFGVTASYVFTADDRLVFAARHGAPVGIDAAALPENGLDVLRNRARESAFDLVRAATGLVRLEGVPHIAAAAPLSPEVPPADPGDPRARAVLLTLKPLSSPMLDRMAERLLLAGLRHAAASPESKATLPLMAADGAPIGALAWDSARPGRALLGWLLPSLAVAGGLLGALATQIALAWRREQRRADVAQGQLAAVLEGAADAIVTFDAAGRVTRLNRAAERLFGRHAADVEDRPLAGFFHALPGDAPPNPESLADRPHGQDLLVVRPDGQTVPVEARVSRLSTGGVPLFTAVVRDIAERKEFEATLRNAKEAAEEASRAKSQFVATMTHELRTPLNAIIGFSEIIRSEALGPSGNPLYPSYAGDIHDSAHHLLEIINDILDISRVEGGRIDLAEKPLAPDAVAGSCIRLMRERAERSGLTLVDAVGDDLPTLLADERLVKQMLVNLLSNAVKFTPSGGTVTVFAETTADGGLALGVADTGPGIPPDIRERVFEPFFQGDEGLNRQFEGTGLGLPLTKALVERHSGWIGVESRPGEGTTVTLAFPASRIMR